MVDRSVGRQLRWHQRSSAEFSSRSNIEWPGSHNEPFVQSVFSHFVYSDATMWPKCVLHPKNAIFMQNFAVIMTPGPGKIMLEHWFCPVTGVNVSRVLYSFYWLLRRGHAEQPASEVSSAPSSRLTQTSDHIPGSQLTADNRSQRSSVSSPGRECAPVAVIVSLWT